MLHQIRNNKGSLSLVGAFNSMYNPCFFVFEDV